MTSSPLGKYANFGAFIAALVVVGVWALQHTFGVHDSDVDQLVLLALGILFGQIGAHTEAVQVAAQKVNGVEATLKNINSRLDAITTRIGE